MERSKYILLIGSSAKCDYNQILGLAGYSVETAASEEEADKLLASGNYELVIKASDDVQCLQLQDIVVNLVDRLSEERRFLALMLNSTPEAISYLDTNLTYLHCNAAAAQQFGRSMNQVIGHRLNEIVEEDSLIYKAILDVFRTGKPYVDELKTTWPDRPELGELNYLVSYIPDIDTSGRIRGIFLSGRDITERKRAEEALRASEERLQKALSIDTVGVLFFSLDGHIHEANSAFERWSGYNNEELRSMKHWEKLTAPEFRKIARRKAQEMATRGKVAPYERQMIRKDGSRWWGLFAPTLLSGSGYESECMEFIVDITERKQADEELSKAREEAERHAAEIESFMTSIADGVTVVDNQGKIIFMNDAGREILGIPDGEALQSWVEYTRVDLDGHVMPLSETATVRALKGEVVTDLVFKRILPWKEIIISVSASPIRDSEGRIIGATNTFRDVSEKVEFVKKQEELLRREQHIAEVLQRSLVPEAPYQPECCSAGVRYEAAFREADIGGDFYDIFEMGNGRVGVLIGDVAGKGLGAAIQVSAVRHAIRNYAYIEPRPEKVMTLANRALFKNGNGEADLLTAFFAVIDTRAGIISYTNAGHETPLVRTANGSIDELQNSGLALGVMGWFEYSEGSRRFAPGDTIVMVTDGVTEARQSPRDLFGLEGVKRCLSDDCWTTKPVEDLADGILEAAKAHAGGKLKDDVAIVVMRWHDGKAEAASSP